VSTVSSLSLSVLYLLNVTEKNLASGNDAVTP
jgi:hypothetical protein